MLRLKPRRRSETCIELVANPIEKGIYAACGLAVVALNLPRPSFSIVSAVLLAACFTATFYFEKWRFDSRKKEVAYTWGFFPFRWNRIYEFSGIEYFELQRASGSSIFGEQKEQAIAPHRDLLGLLRRGTVALSLRTVGGKRVLLLMTQIRHEKEIEATSKLLSSFCGIPLRET